MEYSTKDGVNHKEVLHDHDVISKGITHEEAMHFGVLTEEELVVEKKLKRKIDSLIMPLVVAVYLMYVLAARYKCKEMLHILT